MSLTLPIALVLLAGWVCLAGQVAAALRFARRPLPSAAEQPAVSVLKPLHGAEPGLYENLRSFVEQDYPDVQLVLGVNHPQDGALDAARELIRDFPEDDIALVVDRRIRGSNHKVSNLENMLRSARHDILVLADSDMRVDRRYLAAVTAPLGDAGIGVVTCLYKGVSTGGLWSDLGALQINFGFLPNALFADALGVGGGCFGATIALAPCDPPPHRRFCAAARRACRRSPHRRRGARSKGWRSCCRLISSRRGCSSRPSPRCGATSCAGRARCAGSPRPGLCRVGRDPSAGDRLARRRRRRISLDPLHPPWDHLSVAMGRGGGDGTGRSASRPRGSGFCRCATPCPSPCSSPASLDGGCSGGIRISTSSRAAG